ncbi:MAG: hypothetical protein EBZ83_02450, partial [Verrucomicrobia bacterium]|nr:hypothetical protein [Verrucomicrobiota bacterium]
MASIHKRPRSPFWWGHYPVGGGKWVFRSTKLTDRNKALALVNRYQEMAHGNMAQAQAQKQISEIWSNIGNGEALPTASIGGYLDKWVQRKKAEVAPSTLEAYVTVFDQLKKFLGPRAGLDLKLLTRDDLIRFRQDRIDRTSVSTARHAVKKLNVALNDARRDGLILQNVGEALTRLRRDPEAVETRAFTAEELRKIDQAIDDPEWRGMFMFGLYTGQRLKDVACAEWGKVDFDQQLISLKIHKKGGRWERKFLAPPLLEHLRTMKKTARAGHIFPRAFDYIRRKDRSNVLSNQFKTFLVGAGIVDKAEMSHKSKGLGRSCKRKRTGVGFHSLRHGATSLLKGLGVPHAVAQEIVGHDSAQVSQHYTHVGDQQIRDSLA